MLEADWYIVLQTCDTDYIREAVGKHTGRAEAIAKHTKNITPVNDIPFEEYGLVISFDAILKVPPNSPALFAYYAQEHWDRLYTASLKRPVNGYDVFLAHMMDSELAIRSLPQAISFPYLHDLRLARSTFSPQKQDCVWVDWRTLATLAMMGLGDPWREEADNAARRLQDLLELPIHYRGKHHEQTFAFADPPQWGDAASYFGALGSCKYYIGVGNIAGAGQGLGDAASVGCLCIGQSDKAYHRLICHPSCLCQDIAEMPAKLRNLTRSSDLQREVFAWQDEKLGEHFNKRPLDLLAKAMEMKRNAVSSKILS